MAHEILGLERIGKHFGGVQALRDVSLSVAAGEVHALVGENGAGKSTLLKILCGSLAPDHGRVAIAGEPVRTFSPEHAQARGVAMVYQELNLAPNLSVAENLFLGRYPRRSAALGIVDWGRMHREAAAVLAAHGLDVDPARRVGTLSTGQRQLVEIVRAVSRRPAVLLLDEPTSALSKAEIDLLFQRILRPMKGHGVSIVYVSHRLEEVFAIADTISVLRDGQKVGTAPAGELTDQDVVRLMVGRGIAQRYVKEPAAIGPVRLSVEGLAARGRTQPCSFQAREGEIVGFAGLMGSGRTELLKALVGLLPAEGGRVTLGGRDVRVHHPADAIRAGIAYLSESRRESVIGRLSIAQNVTLANLDEVFPRGVLRRDAERRAATGYLTSLHIAAPGIEHPVSSLSGGNQQKVVLARLLFSGVDVLILDEPTLGIDVGAKVEVYHLIAELVRGGKTVLLVSSELPEVVALSDRVYVMSRGRIAAELAGEAITQENVMRVATGGRA